MRGLKLTCYGGILDEEGWIYKRSKSVEKKQRTIIREEAQSIARKRKIENVEKKMLRMCGS